MSRQKVKLQYIMNQSKRRTTYNKRKTSLLKKVKEISILCGIEACVIIYGETSAQPVVWPPGPGSQNVLHKFFRLSELERNKKAVDLEVYLKQRIEKSQEQLRKQILENKKKRITNFIDKALINQLNNTDLVNMNELNEMKDELDDLTEFIDSNIKEVEEKLKSMNIEAMTGVEQYGNIGNAQGVANGGYMQANVHGLDANVGYDIQSGYQYLPWDNPMDKDGL